MVHALWRPPRLAFTRTAGVLGVTQSALSQAIKTLEESLGIRLLTRTTRSVSPTTAGERLRMATAATPAYFAARGMPKVPGDLTGHRCINIRLPTSGGLYVWEYEKKGREINVRVDGPLVFSTSPHMVDAALDGLGLVHLPVDELAPHLESGRLVRVLGDWCPLFPGYQLYYPSRRQPSPALRLVLEALRI